MRAMIFGAGGLVGNEFARCLSDVLPLTHNDIDVTDSMAVKALILSERPNLVINCSVLGVEACEQNPGMAWSVNVFAAENIAKIAMLIDAEIIHLSTNYVFDGDRKKDCFYTCLDNAIPISVYGKTKLASEYAVSAATDRLYIVRSAWVYGLSEKNFLSTVSRSLKSSQRIRAINDLWANTTYVRDLVSRVLEIVNRGHYGVYHVVNTGVCSYYEFALEAGHILGIPRSKLDKLVEPIEVRELRLCAKRPQYTPLFCLNSERLGLPSMRDWRSALAEYIGLDETFRAFH